MQERLQKGVKRGKVEDSGGMATREMKFCDGW